MLKPKDQELINKILASPLAPLIVETIQAKLEEEKQKRNEFYNDITEQEKAEFINGEVIIHFPVKKFHNEISGNLYKIFGTYVVENDLGFVGIEKVMVQFTRNDYEPDICYFTKEKSKDFKKEQSLFPVPDLIIEVLSKGSEKRDRGIKFEDYQSHGVKEYWIIDTKKKVVEQYQNKKDEFELLLKSSSGDIQSVVLKKLKFPIKAIFDSQTAHQIMKEILS